MSGSGVVADPTGDSPLLEKHGSQIAVRVCETWRQLDGFPVAPLRQLHPLREGVDIAQLEMRFGGIGIQGDRPLQGLFGRREFAERHRHHPH